MSSPADQQTFQVRFDWGRAGASAIASGRGGLAVVVDVLSFTTTLSVAADLGIEVLPYRWADGGAAEFADRHDAVLAVGRSQARPGQVSLSPASLRAGTDPPRVVLPSPNGSTIASQLGSKGVECIGACLRNSNAVAAWVTAAPARPIAVIGAGEQWPDGSLRPAAEDLLGAGALISALAELGWTNLSPEAELAAASYESARGRELATLLACVSGRELVERGFGVDVEIAAEVNESDTVPVLRHGRFEAFRDTADRHE
jgi:2-phosphosulfolactate phosphatase